MSGDEPVSFADRAVGCLLGGALGDALGAPVEFLDLAAIRARFGHDGIRDLAPAYGRLGAITDDTQMTLFTAEGLLRARVRQLTKGMCHVPSCVHHAYLRWLKTQGETPAMKVGTDGWLYATRSLRQRRAPGLTCLAALRKADGFGIPNVAANDSKGCGGVMRAAPVGLMTPLRGRPCQIFELAMETAALTHGHASGFLAAGHFAVMVAMLAEGERMTTAVEIASHELRDRDGAGETRDAVQAALELAAAGRPAPEDLQRLGAGWVAEEALAIAICCALTAEDFTNGVRLAVNHSGDSDSTGAMTGNLLGAALGHAALPKTWLAKLELRVKIERIARDLVRLGAAEDVSDEDWNAYPGW